MKRKFMLAVLCPLVFLGASAPGDLAGNPLAREIQMALDAGLIQAYRDDSFRPEAAITRLETALLLSQLLRKGTGGRLTAPAAVSEAPYPDVAADSPFAPHLAFLKSHSLLAPFSDGLFRPNAPIDRSYFLAAAYKSTKLVLSTLGKPSLENVSISRQTFSDLDGHWSKAYAEILSGFCGAAFATSGNAMEPEKPATRGWAAVSAVRAHECIAPPAPQPAPALEAPPVRYVSATDMNAMLSRWAAAAPSYLQTVTYGNANGYEQKYLRVSRAVSTGERLPKVLITAGTHGDEWTAVGALVQALHKIVSGYGTNPVLTNLVNTRDLHFVTAVCPQSYDWRKREADGQDPNRSYPIPGRGSSGSMPACIRSSIDLFDKTGYQAVLDLHNFDNRGGMILYSWGYTREPIKLGNDADLYQRLGGKLGGPLGYQVGQASVTVRYDAPGMSSDYYYAEGKKRGWNTCAMTAELGPNKLARESELPREGENVFGIIMGFALDGPQLFNGGAGYADRLPSLDDIRHLILKGPIPNPVL